MQQRVGRAMIISGERDRKSLPLPRSRVPTPVPCRRPSKSRATKKGHWSSFLAWNVFVSSCRSRVVRVPLDPGLKLVRFFLSRVYISASQTASSVHDLGICRTCVPITWAVGMARCECLIFQGENLYLARILGVCETSQGQRWNDLPCEKRHGSSITSGLPHLPTPEEEMRRGETHLHGLSAQ